MKEDEEIEAAVEHLHEAQEHQAEARELEAKADREIMEAEVELDEALDRGHEHNGHDDSKIMVNGRQRAVPGDVVSFEELTKIAFPSGPTKPNTRFTITYSNAAQVPSAGELDEGQKVKVNRKGEETIFNVYETVRS